jgi:hypothetical protein
MNYMRISAIERRARLPQREAAPLSKDEKLKAIQESNVSRVGRKSPYYEAILKRSQI